MNVTFSRRSFIKMLGVGTVATLTPNILKAGTIPHIVIVGAGFSGATCAKYLKMWGGSTVQVTIIESNSTYVSPILSNLVLNGKKTTTNLSFTYVDYGNKYNINMIHKSVDSVDSLSKTITLDDLSVINYDKLVLAPGIDFIKTNNYDVTKVPHAWESGEQINLLKSQIDNMVDGDTFIMSIPKAPFRCPPGPYERACVVADYLKNTKGFTNSNVVVLDENSKIIVEENTFSTVFNSYGVDYRPNSVVTNVDDVNKIVSFTENNIAKMLSSTVLNVIPNQKAASLIFTAGVNSGNWASVNPLSYESTIKDDIYIIGDSQGTGQPKAGHIGNSEAKVCADAILRTLNGLSPYPSPKTNSACYSPTSSTEASWLTAVYKYDSNTKTMVSANTAVYPAAGSPSTSNYKEMFNWSGNLFSDTFY
ncbi:MAG: pyridine nucleotide-disulfide oxidoreductase [Arcobacter sp.]|nr:pyridine nucleotide-disulfide oxidoreductase [Arcobacter sp.]